MNRKELVQALAAKAEVTNTDADAVLGAFTDVVASTLASGDKVAIAGFGTFEARERKARTGRNPQTGETMKIAASTAPAFKPGAELKRQIAG